MNKTLIGAVVAVVVVGGVSFYAGMVYGQGSQQTAAVGSRGQFANGQFGATHMGTRGMGGGFTTGQIIAVGTNELTVQTPDGSSKIVLFSTATQVMKMAVSSISNLSVGTNVVITGASNADGSVTAQSVQVRPAGAPGTVNGQKPPQEAAPTN